MPKLTTPEAAAPGTTARDATAPSAPEVTALADFAAHARYLDLGEAAREQLRIRVLDTVGVALAALDAPPIRAIRGMIAGFGETGHATLIGGGTAAPDRAAFFTTALSRYLDFMDSYLAPGETCHPSDNLGAVLAASESVRGTGQDFLTALAVAYQVQTRLSDEAPVRAHGFDHTVQGAYAVPAAVGRALGMPPAQIAHAIAISGTANNALRVTRTGDLSHWKGLAYPQVAKEGMHAALLARAGITGPALVFEGNKGFKETIAGDFTIDWSAEDLESVTRTIVKKHNAEIHSQTTLEAALDIAGRPGFSAAAVDRVEVHTFQVAYDIIGGGEEGDKRTIRTKEEADHSLPYLVAVALIDGVVDPAQLTAERIARDDVQHLMTRVDIRPDDQLTAGFPARMPVSVTVTLTDGSRWQADADSYLGSVSDPLDWPRAMDKFHRLVDPVAGAGKADAIADVIAVLHDRPITDLTALLADVPGPQGPEDPGE